MDLVRTRLKNKEKTGVDIFFREIVLLMIGLIEYFFCIKYCSSLIFTVPE